MKFILKYTRKSISCNALKIWNLKRKPTEQSNFINLHEIIGLNYRNSKMLFYACKKLLKLKEADEQNSFRKNILIEEANSLLMLHPFDLPYLYYLT